LEGSGHIGVCLIHHVLLSTLVLVFQSFGSNCESANTAAVESECRVF